MDWLLSSNNIAGNGKNSLQNNKWCLLTIKNILVNTFSDTWKVASSSDGKVNTGLFVKDIKSNSFLKLRNYGFIEKKTNSYLDFNGLDQDIIGNFTGYNIDSDKQFTIVIKFQSGKNIKNKSLLSKYNNDLNSGLHIYINGNGYLVLNMSSYEEEGGKILLEESSQRYDNYNWYEIIISYDGSKKAEGIDLYVNKEKKIFNINQDNLSKSILNRDNLYIGSKNGSDYFYGSICYVSIFNYKLPSDEVIDLNLEKATHYWSIGEITTHSDLWYSPEDLVWDKKSPSWIILNNIKDDFYVLIDLGFSSYSKINIAVFNNLLANDILSKKIYLINKFALSKNNIFFRNEKFSFVHVWQSPDSSDHLILVTGQHKNPLFLIDFKNQIFLNSFDFYEDILNNSLLINNLNMPFDKDGLLSHIDYKKNNNYEEFISKKISFLMKGVNFHNKHIYWSSKDEPDINGYLAPENVKNISVSGEYLDYE